jgi:hypothetical protein
VNGRFEISDLALVMQRCLIYRPVDFRLTFWACRLTFSFLSVAAIWDLFA